MSFVYPAFLWGLTALAVPLIIHLFNFRRYKVVRFSNVRFLREIKEETATRDRLKHLLVLLARMLAIAFLVLAFAQPFIPTAASSMNQEQRAVSVYLDNSFSMEARSSDRSLLEQGRALAREIAGSYRPDDRFQLITNDFEGRHQQLLSREEFLAYLEEVRISPASRSLDRVLDRQREALDRAGTGNRLVFLISDFQNAIAGFEPDSLLEINLVPLEGVTRANVSLDSAWFEAPVQTLNRPAALHVLLRNHGERDVEAVNLKLYVNGEVKGLADLELPAGAERIDTLRFSVTKPGWQKAEITLTDYPITFDDTWYLAFRVAERLPVLALNEAQPNPWLDRIFGDNALFEWSQNDASRVDFGGLGSPQLLVLNGLRSISSGLATELTTRLRDGGDVLVFPSLDADREAYNRFLSVADVALGASYSIPRKVISIDTEDELFRDVFENVPQNITLPVAQRGYLLEQSARSRGRTLMAFRDETPFLGRYPVGRGNLYLCSSPLDRAAGDLPLQGGILVPMLVRMAILGDRSRPAAYVIGRDEWIAVDPPMKGAEQILRIRNAGGEFIPEQRGLGDRSLVNISGQAAEAGLYDLEQEGTEYREVLALNYDRVESDLQFLDRDALVARYGGAGVRILSAAPGALATQVGALNEGRSLWKLCLILALGFLAVEIVLIRLMP